MRPIQWRPPLATLSVAALLAGPGQVQADDPLGLSEPATAFSARTHRRLLRMDNPSEQTMTEVTDRPSASATEGGRTFDALRRPDESGQQVNVSISPYAWLTSQAGDLTVRGITVDADVTFSDLLDKSDTLFALMGAVDVEYNRFVFQFVAQYSRVTFNGSRGVFRNGTVNSDVTETLQWYELFGGYRLLDRPLGQDAASKRRLTLDGFVGGRVTVVDVDATLSASTTVTLPGGEVLNVGTTKKRDGSEDWFEPFVGARLGLDLSDRWSVSLRGDVGGFDVSGAEFAWSTAALIGYHWKMDGWTLAAFAGYRALGQDYTSGDFGWDVITYGPLLGAQISFSF